MVGRNNRKFGRYRLVGTMADGAMARLFLAVMTGVDGFRRVVVLKQVLPHLSASPEFIHMFLNEARLASRLDHPCIVRIYELGEIDSQYFISMEYLPAEDLTRILYRAHKEKKWIPVTVAATIAQNVADALQCAHDLRDDSGQPLGIVHRDVSLGNILVTYHGTTKLADFGIAKATAMASEISTRVGVFKGKYAYAAPEQVLGKEVDQRTDIFSLGVVLWEMLAVRRLFKRANEAATIHAVEKAEVPPLRSIRPDIPPELEAIALKALAKKPKDRFQSAAEMSDALEEILGKVSARSSSNLLKNWICGLFGEERAELKRATAQGRGFEPHPEDQDDVVLSPEKAALLGLKPLPEQGAQQQSRPPAPSRPSIPPPTTNVARSKSLTVSAPVSSTPVATSTTTSFRRETTATGSIIPRATWSTETSSMEPVVAEAPFDPDATWGSSSKSQSLGRSVSPPAASMRYSIIGGTIAALLIIVVSIGVLLVRKPSGGADAPKGELAIASEPPEASIIVDGRPTGLVTPAFVPNLPTDRAVKVKIEKEGFAPQEVTFKLNGGKNEKTVKLERMGIVNFTSVPDGVLIIIDDRTYKVGDVIELPPGDYKVYLEREKDGEIIMNKAIQVKGGENTIQLEAPR
jgi:serine/threonine protein kinase